MTVLDEQELLREFRKLQIRQTEIVDLLVNNRVVVEHELPTGAAIIQPDVDNTDVDRPLHVGDRVQILNRAF